MCVPKYRHALTTISIPMAGHVVISEIDPIASALGAYLFTTIISNVIFSVSTIVWNVLQPNQYTELAKFSGKDSRYGNVFYWILYNMVIQ